MSGTSPRVGHRLGGDFTMGGTSPWVAGPRCPCSASCSRLLLPEVWGCSRGQGTAGFLLLERDFRASGREQSASIRVSITLFLVALCKFFATSRMWGVLASNSSVTAQQFKQAVLLVEKIKGFVISRNKRGLLGRPSENRAHLGLLPASELLSFPPVFCFSLSLSPGNLSTESLSASHPLAPKANPHL